MLFNDIGQEEMSFLLSLTSKLIAATSMTEAATICKEAYSRIDKDLAKQAKFMEDKFTYEQSYIDDGFDVYL